MATPIDGINGTLGENLVLYLDFDGNIEDKSENTINIEEVGSINYSQDKDGKEGAVEFTQGNYIRTLSDLLAFQNVDVSFSFWVKTDLNTDDQYILYRPDLGYNCYIDDDNKLLRGTYGGTTTGDVSFNDLYGEWTHIFCGIDENAKFVRYVNGVKKYSGNIPSSIFCTLGNPTYIGRGSFDSRGLKDSLDELRIYDRSLSEEEILELYEMGVNYGMPGTTNNQVFWGDKDIKIYNNQEKEEIE